jgi:GntR family transcriptional regulator/MocR family aminotransferase
MSLPRRLQLLEWAKDAGAFVVEDDYDSEFRYEGRPTPALHGLDSRGVVLYLGTFSKSLFPALRLAYLILPPALVPAFARAKAIADGGAPTLEQAVLARFLADGHFARHVRRMRAVYRERREELIHHADRHLRGLLDVESRAAGLQLVGWLPEDGNDVTAAAAGRRLGLGAPPLSAYCLETRRRPALVLGFAHMRPAEIRAGVRTLAAGLTAWARDARRPARPRPARA